MSYKRSFTSSVTVSGEVSVSYPPSEHGGMTSAHYSQTVPVKVNIFVDTNDFDDSVDTTNGKIDQLTHAVNKMNSAQQEQIQKSAEQVSSHLINGFYRLVNQDISTQKMELKNILDSRMAKLIQESKQMQQTKKRMSEDITRLQRYYYKVFRGLDEDLLKRILALDKKAFLLKRNVTESLIHEPYKSSVGNSVLGQQEESILNQQLVSARLKQQSADMIAKMNAFVEKEEEFNASIQNILQDQSVTGNGAQMAPVVYLQDSDGDQNVVSAPLEAGDKMRQEVEKYISKQSEDAFHPVSDSSRDRIEDSLLKMMEESVSQQKIDERTYQEILRLWQNNRTDLTCL